MEISIAKREILVNSYMEHRTTNIQINEQMLAVVNTLIFLEPTVCSNGSSTKMVKTELEMALSIITESYTEYQFPCQDQTLQVTCGIHSWHKSWSLTAETE